MQPASVVIDRVRSLLSAELDRRVALSSQRLPHHCTHNRRHPLDVRKTVDGEPNPNYNRVAAPSGQTIGLCMLNADSAADWNGTICEDPVDALRCPYFQSIVSKQMVWDAFHKDLGDPSWVQANLPEVHALLWVLQSPVPDLPWWKKIWFRLLRRRVEPMTPLPESQILYLLPKPDDNSGI